MLDKLFRGPLFPVTTSVVLGISLLSFWCGELAMWTTIGRVSGPVGAIFGRMIARDFWDEKQANVVGIGLGLLCGLTVGVLIGQCAEGVLVHSLSFRPTHAKNLGGAIGGVVSAMLVGVAARVLTAKNSVR
ncbi:MAG: hypothetical protein HOP18_27335 [Deltaproteobacteria bacterium]|nr:hypothetical protein [Deltaproteobacteria bacterium]